MVYLENNVLPDRETAGVLLATKLLAYKHPGTVILGIPNGGVCVASAVARTLSLPLEIMTCGSIKDPTDMRKDIGYVSPNEVSIQNCPYTIPQDYIAHQIALLRNSIAYRHSQYYGTTRPGSLRYKTVILVDDVLISSDRMLVCLRETRQHNPLKVIVAVPVAQAEAARVVAAESDELVFLKLEPDLVSGNFYFTDFQKIDDNQVKTLIKYSRSGLVKSTEARHLERDKGHNENLQEP